MTDFNDSLDANQKEYYSDFKALLSDKLDKLKVANPVLHFRIVSAIQNGLFHSQASVIEPSQGKTAQHHNISQQTNQQKPSQPQQNHHHNNNNKLGKASWFMMAQLCHLKSMPIRKEDP